MDKKLEGLDRRKAENDRRADEIRLSTIYNTVRDVIFVLNVESQDRYRFASVNRSFLEITGLTEKQVVGKLFTEVIPEPAQALVLGKYREAIRSGKPARWEEVSAYPAGVRVGEVTVAPVIEADGICTQLIGTVHDITDRKQAEEALQQSEEKYRTLVESAAEAIIIAQDGLLKFVNPAACEISGLSRPELLSTPFINIVHPDDRGMVWERYVTRIQGDASFPKYEFRLTRKDGSLKWAELNAVRVAWEGRPATLNFLSDITERKRTEGMLVKSEKRFRQLSDLLPQIVFETDLKGDLTFANKYGIKSFGYSEADVRAGVNIFALFAPDDRAGIQKRLQEILNGSETDVREFRGMRKDGQQFPLLVHATTILEDGVPIGVRGIAIDITERKRAEEQIRQSLAEKETLLREIYHRTKNNMNVIAAMLSLKARTSGDEALVRTFGEIEEKIKAMALVHEKLYKSRDLSRIDFREYVSELAALLMRSRASSAKDLTLALDMAPLAVSIDVAIPCGMILTELFSNTFKHAFPDRKTGDIKISIHRADEAIELFYADNGVGVPPGFDFRSRASLGLQTVFVLVEHQLQGQAAFEGKGGVSCRIRFHDTAGRAGSEL